MYSRQEVSQLRHEFWTTFGRYMSPVLSSEGEKVNWINYKTGEKYVNFRMEAGKESADIAIELTHPDPVVQQLYFEHFMQLRKVMQAELQEEWEWELRITDEHGRAVSRIHKEVTGVSLFKKDDWPALISLFKDRMISLDKFWNKVRYGFEVLR